MVESVRALRSIIIRLTITVGATLSIMATLIPINSTTFDGEHRVQYSLLTHWGGLVSAYPEGYTGDDIVLRVVVFILLSGVIAALLIPHMLLGLSNPGGNQSAAAERLLGRRQVVTVMAGVGLLFGAAYFLLYWKEWKNDQVPVHLLGIGALIAVAVLYFVVYVPALRVAALNPIADVHDVQGHERVQGT
jgi:hypothetical protein